MGLRGPGAKPKELRELEGSASRVVAIATTDIEALPPEMTEDAREVWDDTVATFPPGYFKSADRWHLAAYCGAVATWRKANEKVLALGEVIEQLVMGEEGESTGVILKENPWIKVRTRAHREMVQLGDRLGIGPAKRALSVAASGQSRRTRQVFFRPVQNGSSGSSSITAE